MPNIPPAVQRGHLFQTARRALNQSPKNIAAVLGVASDRTIRRWEGNKLDIPPYVWVVLLTALDENGERKLAEDIATELNKN